MGTNNIQEILASANVTASDVEDAIQNWEVKVMANKQLSNELFKLRFREKKPYSNSVAVIKGKEADVLTWRNMNASHRIVNIAASTPIAGKGDHTKLRLRFDGLYQFEPEGAVPIR